VNGKEPYYLGVFLVGAYQEILGDLHNLFGEPNGSDHHKKYNLNGSRGSFGRTKEGSLDNLRKG